MRKLLILGMLLLAFAASASGQTPAGGYTSPGSSSGSGTASFGSGVIDPTASPYSAKFNVVKVTDASNTNGTAVVTCPNADCGFTPASVGLLTKATNQTSDVTSTSSVLCFPAGTTILTYTSATQVTLSNNSSVCGTLTASMTFLYGTDDTTALNSAWTATAAICGTLLIPAGRLAFSNTGIFNTYSPCTTANGIVQDRHGANVTSLATGPAAFIEMIAGASSVNCTGPNGGGSACIGGGAVSISNVSFDGGGESAIGAGFNGKFGIEPLGLSGSNSQLLNMELSAWGTNTAGFIGESIGGSGPQVINVQNDGWGGTNCQFSTVGAGSGIASIDDSFCAVGLSSLSIPGGVVSSTNSIYGYSTSNSNASVSIAGGAVFNSVNDDYPYITNGQAQLSCNAPTGGTINLVNDYINTPSASSYGVVTLGAGVCKINASQTQIVVSGATPVDALFISATSTWNDNCGNTITGPLSFAAGAVINACPNKSTVYSTQNAGQLDCASAASPAVCSTYSSGSVAVPTGATPTLQINTTAVDANSPIYLTIDESLGTKLGITCNSTLATLVQPVVTARSAGVSLPFKSTRHSP